MPRPRIRFIGNGRLVRNAVGSHYYLTSLSASYLTTKLILMVRATGFEPANDDVKDRCVTTSPSPNVYLVEVVGIEPTYKTLHFGFNALSKPLHPQYILVTIPRLELGLFRMKT